MYYIITKNSIPGFHYWEEACGEFAYLSYPHRHVFEIICKIPVRHDDRDKEIIAEQERIRNYLLNIYGSGNGNIDIGGMSCEALAKNIADYIGADEVTVLEDGFGGAGYVRQ